MTTGEKLSILRHQAGHTGEELVSILNKHYKFTKVISPEMYRNWENDRNEFTWEHGLALADYFGTTLDKLVNPKLKAKDWKVKITSNQKLAYDSKKSQWVVR